MMSFLEYMLKLLQGLGLFRVSELKSNSRQDSNDDWDDINPMVRQIYGI